jgi:hypothetical protein
LVAYRKYINQFVGFERPNSLANVPEGSASAQPGRIRSDSKLLTPLTLGFDGFIAKEGQQFDIDFFGVGPGCE